MTASPRTTTATNVVRQYDDHERQPRDPGATLDLDVVLDRLGSASLWWQTLQQVDERPRVRPVFAVVAEGDLFTTSSSDADKTTTLASPGVCTMSTSVAGMDVVWDGSSRRHDEPDVLARVSAAYHDRYGWPTTPTDGGLDAPFGAPAAGAPPYHVFRIVPERVYAFGTDDEHAPRSTRFDFPA